MLIIPWWRSLREIEDRARGDNGAVFEYLDAGGQSFRVRDKT